jgi:hypothetical protein
MAAVEQAKAARLFAGSFSLTWPAFRQRNRVVATGCTVQVNNFGSLRVSLTQLNMALIRDRQPLAGWTPISRGVDPGGALNFGF